MRVRVGTSTKTGSAKSATSKQPSLSAPTPAASKIWQPTPEQQAFFDHVAKLPAEEQAEAVAEKLKEVNPGFDGTTKHKVEDSQVVYFRCRSEHLTDIWPVRALGGLKELNCGSDSEKKAKLSDLSPLQGKALTQLICWQAPVADISPLRGMPLVHLTLQSAPVSDLAPLHGAPLIRLNIAGSLVDDLTPLIGMKLERFDCTASTVTDLAPLMGMPLKHLQCGYTPISDLSPIQGMPLEHLTIAGTRVKDIHPLAGMPLTVLHCGGEKLRDLSPLRGMPLIEFHCTYSRVVDITPLAGMKLTVVNFYKTPVSDISPLAGMPLQKLTCDVRLFDENERALIQSLPLTHLNGPTPFLQALKDLDARRQAALAFAEATAKLSPEEQIEAVVAKLAELNNPNAAKLHVRRAANGITNIILTLEGSIHRTPIDITPLMGFTKLKTLEISGGTPYLDISCTKHLSLEELYCDDWILFKNVAVLKGIQSLKRVNGHPVDEYLDYVAHEGLNHFAKPKLPPIPWDVTAEQQAFFDHVATLPPEEQAEAVAQKMMGVNPGYDGKFEKTIQNGQVVGFKCHTDKITNPTTDVWRLGRFRHYRNFIAEALTRTGEM